jgi:hypothetical protein
VDETRGESLSIVGRSHVDPLACSAHLAEGTAERSMTARLKVPALFRFLRFTPR